MNTPQDCLVVKLKEGVSPFSCRTWRIYEKDEKNIPLDIYNLVQDKLVVTKDPHGLLMIDKEPEPEEKKPEPLPTVRPPISKVKKSGKGKNK